MGHKNLRRNKGSNGVVMPRSKKKKVNDGLKTARLNLLIRPDLKTWVHEYARKKNQSVSSLITEHFVILRERERGSDVEQI